MANQDPEENLPDWLKALRNKKDAPGEEPAQSPEPIEPGESVEPEETPAGDEPSWLQEIRKRRQSELDSKGSARDEHSLTDTQPNAPSRLQKRRLQRAEEKTAAEPPREEPQPDQPTSNPSGLPDWLDSESQSLEPAEPVEISDEESELPTTTPALQGGAEEPLSPGELPSWLQAIRPGGISYPDEDTRSGEMLPGGDQESVGPLAGLSGVLQAEPEIAKIGKAPVFSSRLEVSESQYRHAAVLRDLVAGEAAPKEDQAKIVARPTRILNAVMAVGLMLAVLVPLVRGGQTAARPELKDLPASVTDLFDLIEVLPPDAPVLIAFDVEPAFYGEMQAPIGAVLSHLMDRQARLAFISTQPTGPALAERILRQQFASSPIVATGDYTDLGYLAGGMAALRSFSSDPRTAALSASATAQNPWNSSALQSIDQFSDFALVFVIASDAEDGRAWIEQTGAALPNGLAMVSSAQAAPVMQPYLSAYPATLSGLVSGLAGGAYYEEVRARDGLGRADWDAFSYGLGAIFFLILLGGLYGRLIQTRPEKATLGEAS